jgi:O-methyltransferase
MIKMKELLNNILSFNNKKIDGSIINDDQIKNLVFYLLDTIDNNIEGDIVEFGCYVGESSKYLMKTLLESNSNKKLFVYDSFEGLPPLSKWEENSGWRAGTLKSSEEVLISNFEQNNLPLPIIHKDWFKNVPEDKIPEKISFAFLDGDFYDSIYDSLSKVLDRVTDGGYICFHDYQRNDLPGVRAAIEDVFKERGVDYTVEEVCEQLGVYRKNGAIENRIPKRPNSEVKYGGTTIVTGIWDIKREELTEGWSRKFDHYLNHLSNLMKTDDNMIIYIEEKYRSFVEERRAKENTLIIVRELEWFKKSEFFDKIQKIRNNPDWFNTSGWLPESTQAKLEMYNPIVMSKVFLLNDASIMDPFNSSHLVWVDGAITNTVHEGYFWKDKITNNISKNFNKFTFVCFSYDGKVEIHGFKYDEMCRYSEDEVNKVARGGIFGGPKHMISKINEIYYSLMNDTLSNGLMGTEESLFTIITYKYPELVQYYEIGQDGLLGVFFENLKNNTLLAKQEKSSVVQVNPHSKENVALYVMTYNSPKQFEKLCMSFEMYDRNFLDRPKKFLLNNSLNRETDVEYSTLCMKYGFEEIKKDNLGICGGRQFIAEHSEENGFDYHMFFEDDMFFYLGPDEFCKNGFRRKIKDFYNIMMDIAWNENFDFLKWNFTEFFGNNSRQWSWHNVSIDTRSKLFPEKPVKTNNDHNYAPYTNFKNIKIHRAVPYITGEIYYCNWPQVVSKEGNRKMFLAIKWDSPFEQTWMSHIFQETLKNNIKPGLLLASPTEHDRFEHYSSNERREN